MRGGEGDKGIARGDASHQQGFKKQLQGRELSLLSTIGYNNIERK
jgi:hypothetical protein